MSDHVEEHSKKSLDEIVFENRNKAYGAYDLRKSYRRILTKATIIGVLLFSIGVGVPFIVMKIKQINAPNEKNVDLNLLDIDQEEEDVIIEEEPEEELPPPPKEEEPEEIEVIRNVVPEPVKNPPKQDPPPKISDQKKTTTGLVPKDGKKIPGATPPPSPPKNPGKGSAVNTKPPVDDNKVYTGGVEQEAEFPGGLDALRQYIADEFDPYIIEDLEEVVTTKVSFVVEKNGTITDVEATGGSSEYRKEAMRVIKSIRKKWKPAKVDGKPVRYRYRVPITMGPPEY